MLHEKKTGRRLLLGAELDDKIHLYLKKVRKANDKNNNAIHCVNKKS